MLGKVGFGEFGIIQSTVGMFGVFAGFGLGLTATKHVAEFRVQDPERAGRFMALSELVAVGSGGIMAVALVVCAPWLAEHTLAAPHLKGPLQVSAALLFLSALNGAQTGALSGFEAFKTTARVNVLAGLASFPLMVGGVLLAGLRGAVWGLVASMGVNWILNHFALRVEARKARVPFTLKGCAREGNVLLSFSLPAVLSGAMVGPVGWACSAMLVNRPNGYAEMGVFNAANQAYNAMLFLPGILGQVVLPILSERLGDKDRHRSGRLLTFSIKLNGAVVLPLMLVGCAISPFIMRLYGATFTSAWPTLIVALLTAGLLAVQLPVGQVIAASGKMWTGFIMNMGWGLAFMLITYVLIGRGAFGLSLARACAYLLHTTWTFGFAYCYIARERELVRK
jgi:O-antigen/teichoic acid export membrane protein